MRAYLQFAFDAAALLLLAFEPRRFPAWVSLPWWIVWGCVLVLYPFAFVIAGVVELGRAAWAAVKARRARKPDEAR